MTADMSIDSPCIRSDEINELEDWITREHSTDWHEPAAIQRLLGGLRMTFNICLDEQQIKSHDTPRSLAIWMVDSADDLYRPLVRLNRPERESAEEKLPLVICVHALFGFAQTFRRLARTLDPVADVWAIQARGFNPGETPFTDNESLLECYLRSIINLAGDRPVHMLGFSSGGTVAHALGAALSDSGHPVGPVFVLDTILYTELPEAPTFDAFLTMMFVGIHSKLPPSELEHFQSLDHTQRLAYFFHRLVKAVNRESMADNISDSALRRLGRLSYSLHLLHRSFQPQTFSGKTVLIRSGDSSKWGEDFKLWDPPSRTVVHERIASLHGRLLSTPYALRRIRTIFEEHRVLS